MMSSTTTMTNTSELSPMAIPGLPKRPSVEMKQGGEEGGVIDHIPSQSQDKRQKGTEMSFPSSSSSSSSSSLYPNGILKKKKKFTHVR
ncbi:hypothetical protein RFI_37862 [Reticulomyxa filosa]|uniref:Uncharacterized protein n=1 Tax=Reticulomyxa filosa TaxID=46433 RepID=X6LDH8_RETFI|nr:hypothetical protein RFI_37862 [Reticulomyxa filosa]|eukprot:ETN99608.1 hypothetical protein RFI_37862 [Reticulomyxa filosa]